MLKSVVSIFINTFASWMAEEGFEEIDWSRADPLLASIFIVSLLMNSSDIEGEESEENVALYFKFNIYCRLKLLRGLNPLDVFIFFKSASLLV